MLRLAFSISSVLLTTQVALAADFRILVLDGHTGRPVPHTRVLVFGDVAPAPFGTHVTDRVGVLAIDSGNSTSFRVEVEGRVLCMPRPTPAFSVADTLTTGVTSPNTCSTRVTASSTPGTLTVFVRNMNLFEKMMAE